MQENGQQIICDECQFKFKSFYRQWKLNNNNNKLFIFRVQKKYQTLSKNVDLSELIPDYAFVCNSTWFALYSIKKIQRMRTNTIRNLNFKQGTLLIGFYWYRIFINGIMQTRWYNLPRV
ncbi:hypothetical protein [Spiroplasma melliferum]|uniref:Uncharacterized protein n=2 Tax=Spiroplasma melliferum TaxID=2134 RepID=A0AAI9T4C2_SPIME|nr:hypothetical protein [Spiroplasma melliferum]KAI93139.1 hypothetical protein SPM_001955 [Spiroplasma melliferum KC3]QCO24427.1 hypothetical protein SRED_002924 [Spiroplasma melliferum]